MDDTMLIRGSRDARIQNWGHEHPRQLFCTDRRGKQRCRETGCPPATEVSASDRLVNRGDRDRLELN